MNRILLIAIFASSPLFAAEAVPDYSRDVQPILQKHCAGCHNADDKEGGLSMDSYADLMKGGEHGPALSSGAAASSRMIQMSTGKLEPVMPPDGLDPVSEAEIKVLTAWIDAGAKGPSGKEPPRTLNVPKLAAASLKRSPITAMATFPQKRLMATGQYGQIDLKMLPESGSSAEAKTVHTFQGLPGKVTSLEFSSDGTHLLAGTGITGLSGTAILFHVDQKQELRRFTGATDMLYSAALHPEGTLVATAGYDRVIRLYDLKSADELKQMRGHNDAIYDLAFSPDGKLLVSASGDETCKVWDVASGERFDTLGQPQAEQTTVLFTPDGRHIVAGGNDQRIRVWRVVSKSKPRTNPIVYSRLAHEGGIVQLMFSEDGAKLISIADDKSVKLWETKTFTPLADMPPVESLVTSVGLSPGKGEYLASRIDGGIETGRFTTSGSNENSGVKPVTPKLVQSAGDMQSVSEAEPNGAPATATAITLPATIKGTISAPTTNGDNDDDLYRFEAKAGEQWVFEVNAARSKSPLDSTIEILDANGEPIVRVLLQAVRDSWFTFRGKDSNTSDDFRVFNWQEMELNELLYSNGEVSKLWHYPRGPDSGFRVYPGFGSRHAFFDTTPLSHPLQEPIYIVKPIAPGEQIIPNGLPVFPIRFFNDDDGRRKLGKDSRLTFTAPDDGIYLLRVRDARGFGSDKHTYTVTARPRTPDFSVRLLGDKPSLVAGSAAEFEVRADRMDDFEGPIEVTFSNVPEGISIPQPIIIQEGQYRAYGTISAAASMTAPPSNELMGMIRMTATAMVAGKPKTQPERKVFNQMTFMPKPPVLVKLRPADGREVDPNTPWVLEVSPGETVSAIVEIERNGNNNPISFGKDESGRNLPHGVFVDNIGLNGLLIVPKSSKREFFITASPIATPMERLFHLKVGGNGNQASQPVLLRVKAN